MAAKEVEAQASPGVGERSAARSGGTPTGAGSLPALKRSGLPRGALTPAMMLQVQRTAGNQAAAGLAASVPGRDLASSSVAGLSAGSLSRPARRDESEREHVQSRPGRSARPVSRTLQRMQSKASPGEEIPDAILIGERHNSTVAKTLVLAWLNTWRDEGYTRLGVEKAADQVIPEDLFDEEVLADIGRVTVTSEGWGGKSYTYIGVKTGEVLAAARDNDKLRKALPAALPVYGDALLNVIGKALRQGYSVECLDTVAALEAPMNERVGAFDVTAAEVIAKGAKGFIALVGADHLEGIAERLGERDWSFDVTNTAREKAVSPATAGQGPGLAAVEPTPTPSGEPGEEGSGAP